MAQPTPYERQFSFSDFSTENPADPQPGSQIDGEFNNIKQTIDQILANVALIQRDDGELGNDTVGADQLKAELTFGFNEVVDWGVGVAYAENDGVWYLGTLYRCVSSHTSTVFATDLAAGRWSLLVDIAGVAAPYLTGAQVAASAAGSSAAAAATSEANAAAYAAALAGTSATSTTIGTGSKSFTTQSGKFFSTGQFLKITSRANSANYMYGVSTGYSGTSLTVNVTDTGGSGTLTDWDVLVSGAKGAVGAAGAPGPGTGDVLAANNGSEFANKNTTRTNLGLGSGDNATFNTLLLNAATNQIQFDADATNKLTLTMAALSAARTQTFPDKTGTFAMTSDLVAASATVAGFVELATDAEAQTGTDTGRALTPANLQAVTATESRKGVVELATTLEVVTGTDTVRAVTPAGVSAALDATGTALVLLDVKTADSSASLDFTQYIDSTYDEYEFHFSDIIGASDSQEFLMRTSSDGGASFSAGASDYKWALTRSQSGTTASGERADTADNAISMSNSLNWSNASTEGIYGSATLYKPAGTTNKKIVRFHVAGFDADSQVLDCKGAGGRLATDAVNAVRFLMSAGVIESGVIRMYGVRKA